MKQMCKLRVKTDKSIYQRDGNIVFIDKPKENQIIQWRIDTQVSVSNPSIIGCGRMAKNRRKIMKRKLLVLITVCSMIVGLLAGCSGSKSSSSNELNVWLPTFAGTDSEFTDEEFWTEELKQFEEDNNCKINLTIVPWDSYEEKYLTGINSQDGPDIGYMYMEMYYDYIKMGALEPLEAYFSEDEANNYLYYDAGKFFDKQYALPIVVGNPRILVANMDILNAAGIEAIPTNWDELVQACQTLKEYDADIYPFVQDWGNTHFGSLNEIYWPFFWSAGGEIVDSEGNLTIDSEAGLKATQFVYDLKNQYNILTDAATSIDDTHALMKEGKAAMAFIASANATDYNDAGFKWDYLPYLNGPDGEGYTFVAADSLVLLSSCENKELAATCMKYITSPDVMEKFHSKVYGAPSISADEEYMDLEIYKNMYTDETQHFKNLPVFEGATSFYDTLYKNLQSMMMGELSPEEVLKNTTDYYKTSIKTK